MNLGIPAGAGRGERFNGLYNSNYVRFWVQSVSSSSTNPLLSSPAKHLQWNPTVSLQLVLSVPARKDRSSLSNIYIYLLGFSMHD